MGAKTGTAQKVSVHGGYKKHSNYSSFIAAFPIYAPRYVVYVAIDSGHATAATHGFTTGGYMAAPSVAHVIARIGPMLNVMPRFDNVEAINEELAVPMPYPAPPGVVPLGPNDPGEPDDIADVAKPGHKAVHRSTARIATGGGWVAPAGAVATLRHDAMYRVPASAVPDAAR